MQRRCDVIERGIRADEHESSCANHATESYLFLPQRIRDNAEAVQAAAKAAQAIRNQ